LTSEHINVSDGVDLVGLKPKIAWFRSQLVQVLTG
jgi:hypothetical protein